MVTYDPKTQTAHVPVKEVTENLKMSVNVKITGLRMYVLQLVVSRLLLWLASCVSPIELTINWGSETSDRLKRHPPVE